MTTKPENSKSRQTRDNASGRVNTAVFRFGAFAAALQPLFRALRACLFRMRSAPKRDFLPETCLHPLRKGLALAFNAAAERCIAYSIATNIAPIISDDESADDYKLLAPYGDTDYWIEDGKGGFKKLIQRFTAPQAAKIVAAFNAYRVRQGKSFIGMPIYRGHPDADPVRWPDDRRYGHLLDVQQRADGLYVKPAWNDLGLDNKKNHYLPYPSVAWLYDIAAAARTGIIEPDEIQSVGLTNQPRMKNVPVWTNAEAPTSAQTQKEKEKNTMPRWLIDKLVALNVLKKPAEGAEPTEAELQAACSRLAVNTDPMEVALGQKKISVVIAGDNREAFLAELAALATNTATALNTATEEAKKFKKLAINAHLDRAIDKGVITAADRPQFGNDFEADFDAALVKLNAKKPALNTQALDPLKPVNHADLSTPRGRQVAFNIRIDEIQAEARKGGREISIDDAINKMRGNAADAALLKAMEPTTAS